jgi:hypothetical protein
VIAPGGVMVCRHWPLACRSRVCGEIDVYQVDSSHIRDSPSGLLYSAHLAMAFSLCVFLRMRRSIPRI